MAAATIPPAGGLAPPPVPGGAATAASSRRFAEALIKSIGVIGASEIGDKTFFIAALMAMRHPRWTVFGGALGALAAMTVLSAALGWAAPALIPKVYTHYAATALFFFFGGKTLYDVLTEGGGGHGGGNGGGGGSSGHEPSELEQVEQELAEREAAGGMAARSRAGSRASLKDAELPYHTGAGGGGAGGAAASLLAGAQKALRSLLSPVLINAFTLTFLAEWGDRSQIATIGLAASQDVVGVTLGSIVGHAACTGVAVLGGRHLAAHIDERTVGIVGGLIFLAFGLHSLYEGPPA